MKKILVQVYSISPTKGSEYSVAWNYVTRMSKYCEITVLCGVSGEHIGDLVEIERYVIEHNIPNVKFIFVKSDWFIDLLNILNRKGVFVYSFYIAYRFWQKKAYKIAKEIIAEETFDLIHFLGPIGYREPGYLWKLDLPYIWGPIGGMYSLNIRLLPSLSFSGKLKLGIRRIINEFQLKYKRTVRNAINRSDLLLACTTETQRRIKEIYNIDASYLPENGIDKIIGVNRTKFETISKLQLIIVGRLDAGKSVITILKALEKIDNPDLFVLNIVGDGPLMSQCKEFVYDNGLNNSVIFHGKVDRNEVFDLMNNAHLHIITSVSEANTTVIWEAMSVGVPTLSLDHCGMHDTICDKCGFKIPIITYDQVVNDIALKIQECIDNPSLLKDKADGVLDCAQQYTWEKREAFWLNCYEKAICKYNTK